MLCSLFQLREVIKKSVCKVNEAYSRIMCEDLPRIVDEMSKN